VVKMRFFKVTTKFKNSKKKQRCAIIHTQVIINKKQKNQSSFADIFKETQPGLYEEINYEISGPGARAFYYDHLRSFQCVEFCRVLPEKKNT